MTKSKKIIGIGIVFAIVALAISLMCISASYAKTNDSNETNVAKALTIDASESDDVAFNFEFSPGEDLPEGCGWDYDTTTRMGTFAFVEGIESYNVGRAANKLSITFIYQDKTYKPHLEAKYDSQKVVFKGFTNVPDTEITDQAWTVGAKFIDPTKPKVFDSVTVSGKTGYKNTNGEDLVPVSGATLRIANVATNKIYGSAVSDNNGNYVISNIDKSIFTEASDPDDIRIYGCAKSFSINDKKVDTEESRIVDKVLYIDNFDIQFHKADVTVIGDSHHQDFLLNMTASVGGEVVESYQYLLPCFGIDNDQISKGANFTIKTNGEFVGTAKTEEKGFEVDVSLNCVPISKDGSSFDRFELDGNKYLVGDSFSLDGNSQHEGVVYYSAIPQTGDAIPYAVVIGLGVIALIAFGICRKQFN